MSEKRIANGQYSAPELKFNGEKVQDNEATNQTYQIPQHLADIINKELGDSSAQIKVMYVLVGTKEGFRITEKWICDRTGLAPNSYRRARAALEKIGWITHTQYESITINFDEIYKCGKAHSDS